MWPFLAVLLFSFTCMAITMLFQIYRELQALRGRTVLEEPVEKTDATH
jgi:TRAP-type mannitol/chloroaromatic compound transport system permease small subunit